MPARPVADSDLIDALNLVEEYGSSHKAWLALGDKLGMGRSTLESRVQMATLRGFKPTFRKDAPRIHTRERLGRMHIVIPDTQVKDGVPLQHLEWIGHYIAEKKPDVIVQIGDFADMPSLSMYDRGKLAGEGRRYTKDIAAVHRGMDMLMTPIRKVPDYKPEMHLTLGNHEFRIIRETEENPSYEGKFSYDDLHYEDYGWQVHDFLQVVELDGIEYAHYFTSGSKGNAVSSAAALARERQGAATMGHSQYTDMFIHKKTQRIAMFCGTAYLHDESYLGHQGNNCRRQIVVKHEVDGDGHYDPMFVSLNFLRKFYS